MQKKKKKMTSEQFGVLLAVMGWLKVLRVFNGPRDKKGWQKKKRTLAMQKWRKRHYIIVIINTSAQLRLDAGNHYVIHYMGSFP